LENLKERDHLEHQGVGGKIILDWIWEGVNWILLADIRDQWWAVLDMVMNLWVP
jgi:hypothetical protein